MTPTARQFREAATRNTGDTRQRAIVQNAIASYQGAVSRGRGRFRDWPAARARAAAIKWETINHLDRYLEQFERAVSANGGRVHWAETAAAARAIVLTLGRQHGVRQVVKAKSMITEEIELNNALETAGIRAVETDLGEYICQLRGEPPYHIVTPVMHLSRADIAREFHEQLGVPLTDNAAELTAIAREKLRQAFLSAEMGVSGANFAIAETGQVALTENEGNIRLGCALPRVHVAIVGIEKLLPRVGDLALFWPLLAASGTGQALTAYSSLVGGPRRDGEPDGPEEFHVILLDNGRTRLLADAEQRDALHCIRCGACLNACPVYRAVGGHAYGTTYQGPIGAVITPHLRDPAAWSHLADASSLCGACTDVCPVQIDLHHHLLHNRRNAVRRGFDHPLQRLLFRAWAWAMRGPARYRLAGRLAGLAGRLGLKLPRDFPAPARQSFRHWWQTAARQPADTPHQPPA